jgi:hypothetical protein
MRTYTRSIALAGLLLAASASPALAQGDDITSQIPFDFVANGKLMPRGTYQVLRSGTQNQVYTLRTPRGGVVLLAHSLSWTKDSGTPWLRFHRYGDRYVLRGMLRPDGMEVSFPETKRERRMVEEQGTSASAAKPEVVIVPAVTYAAK